MTEADLIKCSNCHWAGWITKGGAMCPGCHCIETFDVIETGDVPKAFIKKSDNIELLYNKYEQSTKEGKLPLLHPQEMREIPFHDCCPYCAAGKIHNISPGFVECGWCGKTFHKKDDETILVPATEPLLHGELYPYTKTDEKITVNGMELTFAILFDSAGEHPLWENEFFEIFTGIEQDGNFGLFIDINHGEEREYTGLCDGLTERPKDFEEYKQMCTEAISTLLQTTCPEIIGKRIVAVFDKEIHLEDGTKITTKSDDFLSGENKDGDFDIW